MRRFCLITTVKDEGPSIVEWVAHHLNIGFTDIVIYENDSSDDTRKLLRTMNRLGFITFFPNPDKNKSWQNKAYRRASRLNAYKDADWAMALDGDEYLVVKVGDGKVADLVDAVPDGINCIQVNWKLFGSSFRKKTSDALVTEDFIWAEDSARISQKLIGFKSIFKPSVFKRTGIHRPKDIFRGQTENTCNGSGIRAGQFNEKLWRSADQGLRKLAQVNHYIIRDAQRFIIKSDRGRTSNKHRHVALEYWLEYELHDEIDRTLLDKSPETRARIAQMNSASKNRLNILTELALQHQNTRFDLLMLNPQYKLLFEQITGRVKI
mgnify:CR=1 FL=1